MSHEERDYIKQLHKHGFRVTLQRLIVLDAVCDVGGHATIASIFKRVEDLDPTIDQSTIYRALDVLTEAQLVVSSVIDGTRVYEIAASTPHHHLVCKRCGEMQPLSQEMVQPLLERIQKESGFRVEPDHLILPGICSKCLNG
ncbi:MAG: transcriptional repressor [Anaerolineae bacterium]|nr:transcriptional repressor [Anaerolineae bacterium]